jgi:hypothetical protein
MLEPPFRYGVSDRLIVAITKLIAVEAGYDGSFEDMQSLQLSRVKRICLLRVSIVGWHDLDLPP